MEAEEAADEERGVTSLFVGGRSVLAWLLTRLIADP